MLILDTSAVIEVLKSTENGAQIADFVRGQDTAITSFTVHEIMVGAKESEAQKIAEFLSEVKILNFDPMSAMQSALIEKNLISKGKKIEESDVFIAGICIANNSRLVTLDKGFLEIKGMEVKFF